MKAQIIQIVEYTKHCRLGDATVAACSEDEKKALTAVAAKVETAQKAFAAVATGRILPLNISTNLNTF